MSANSKIEWTDHTFNPWIVIGGTIFIWDGWSDGRSTDRRRKTSGSAPPSKTRRAPKSASIFAIADLDVNGVRAFSKGDFTGHQKVGKHAAGRLLDGQEHNAFPI